MSATAFTEQVKFLGCCIAEHNALLKGFKSSPLYAFCVQMHEQDIVLLMLCKFDLYVDRRIHWSKFRCA